MGLPLKKFLFFFIYTSLIINNKVHADVQLPIGAAMNGCPFIHEDSYDVGYLINTLKSQISAELNNRRDCRETSHLILSNLTPLNDFYKSIDPAVRQKITRSVYANTLSALTSKKIQIEMTGNLSSSEYSNIIDQIRIIEESNITNNIELDTLIYENNQSVEAHYRNQLQEYTSNLLKAYNFALKNNPNCVNAIGGWEQTFSAVMGGFSMATGLGVNPTAQIIGAAARLGAQLVILLQGSEQRKSLNDLTKLQNYKTLACTYYSMKRASCEYQRTYKIADKVDDLKKFMKNQYSSGNLGEYEKYFINLGRVNDVGRIFAVIAKIGSPLTRDLEILSTYFQASAIDFRSIGEPPLTGSNDETIKTWLLNAKTFGIKIREEGFDGPLDLEEQLKAAISDIKNKKATIAAAESLMKKNPSFQDLKRSLSSDFPSVRENIKLMSEYLSSVKNKIDFIQETDKETIEASIILLSKLHEFLNITLKDLKDGQTYDDVIVEKGSAIFMELAKGSVAQLNKQSAIALTSIGTNRLGWAYGVIRNAYLTRDLKNNLPTNDSFSEYRKNRDVLSDVVANYKNFSGKGPTFRNEDFAITTTAFEDSFKETFLESLSFSIKNTGGIQELRGQTARQLCALYYPSLITLAKKKKFKWDNPAAKILNICKNNFKELPLNKLVSDKDFKINYKDECTYFEYMRELEIQNLLAKLIR